MSNSKIFFSCCLFFIAGIFIRSLLALPSFVYYSLLILIIICFLGVIKNRYFFILALWGFFLFLGLGRYQLALPLINKQNIANYLGQEVEFIGVVSKEPDVRADKVKLTTNTHSLWVNDHWQSVKGEVLLTTYLFPQYQYGDSLEIICNLQKPGPINDFAYDHYLARYNIYSLCYNPQIKIIGQNKGNFILAGIYQLKDYFVGRLNRILPEPQSSFLAGLLIGAKKSMPQDLQTVFSKTGTTHIVAVSGYNVTIIATFLMLIIISFGISRKKSFGLIIVLLIIFTILTGAQASIVRATIMGILVLLANYLGRVSRVKNALILTACLMLVITPQLLVFDLGFQLSFLATLGLIYLAPILIKISKIEQCKLPIIKLIVNDYLMTTLAAIIITQPLILYQFGKVSLIAPLANILVLPLIPLAMLLGFIAGLAALVWLPLGWVLSWLVWLVLSYIIFILAKLAELNWAYWEIPKISWWLMGILYLIIFYFIYKFRNKFKSV